MSRWQPESAYTRMMAKTDVGDGRGCWVWRGSLTTGGYGQIRGDNGKLVMTHRLSYETAIGPIPDGKVLDHLCRNRACVNPDHLEPVSGRTNILRGIAPTALNAAKTHCVHGHEFTDDNLVSGAPSRQCRTCANERSRKRYRVAARA